MLTKFCEHLVSWTLGRIGDEFSAVGIIPDRDYDPPVSGKRRRFVEQHYASLNPDRSSDERRSDFDGGWQRFALRFKNDNLCFRDGRNGATWCVLKFGRALSSEGSHAHRHYRNGSLNESEAVTKVRNGE